MQRPYWRLSSTRLPLCPFKYQQEVVLGIETTQNDYAWMGQIGHHINSLYIDGISSRTPPHQADHGLFNHLWLKHTPPDFPYWLAADLKDVLDTFMWNFKLDTKAEQHITEINLAYDRQGNPCDPEADTDRVTFQPDYVRIYNGGAKAAIDDWKLGYIMFDYQAAAWPTEPDQRPNKVCVQLGMYANGWFKLHPECHEIMVTVFGPRWGRANLSSFRWTRDFAAQCFDPMIAGFFTLLDNYWEAFGDTPWPAKADWWPCQWCNYDCPHPELAETYRSPETSLAALKKQESWAKSLTKDLAGLTTPQKAGLNLLLAGGIKSYAELPNANAKP
jgi:hypothetical protein